MAFDKIKEGFDELPDQMQDVVTAYAEYYKLLMFRFVARSTSIFLKAFVIGVLLVLFSFFLFTAVAFALGNALGSIALGFVGVSVVFFLILYGVYFFRKTLIEQPLLAKLSEFYFDQEQYAKREESYEK